MNIDEYARVVAIAADGTTSVLMNPKSAISDEFMIAMKRAGFTPPAGPGRCAWCGFHTKTQGHRDGCPDNDRKC